jgi:hypothetical protein
LGDPQYTPDSAKGRRLLAHELAHVVQQSGNGGPNRMISNIGQHCIQRTVYADTCRPDQWAGLHAAVFKVRTDISRALPQLLASPLSSRVRDALWVAFRTESESAARQVHDRLNAIHRGLPGATIDCEQEDDLLYSLGCGGGAQAYTWRIGSHFGPIHVCMEPWPRFSSAERSRFIAHESSHLFNNTSDHGYFLLGCDESAGLTALSSGPRLDNADSYACFVHHLSDTPRDTLAEWATNTRRLPERAGHPTMAPYHEPRVPG